MLLNFMLKMVKMVYFCVFCHDLKIIVLSILRSASLISALFISLSPLSLVLFSWHSTPTGVFTEEGRVPWIESVKPSPGPSAILVWLWIFPWSPDTTCVRMQPLASPCLLLQFPTA